MPKQARFRQKRPAGQHKSLNGFRQCGDLDTNLDERETYRASERVAAPYEGAL